MQTAKSTLVDLERRFWQSVVDQDAATAIRMLGEPALMVSQHGAMKFDHDAYRRMAENGPLILKAFELRDVEVIFPAEGIAILTYRATPTMQKRDGTGRIVEDMYYTSTWVTKGAKWICVAHTEVPVRH